jgi:HEAT repeat protein
METWQDLDNEQDDGARERTEALWQALEDRKQVPATELLGGLSGLVDESLARAGEALRTLPPEARRELIHSLSRTANDDMAMDFSAIFRMTMADADADVRVVSITGLDDVDDARLVPAFAQILRNDPSEAARTAAADALSKYVLLGELERIRPIPFNAAVLALRESYLKTSESPRVRRQALKAIAYTEEHGVRQLIADARKDSDEAMRISAVVAMGHSANGEWSSAVRRELSSSVLEMRRAATRAGGELRLREAVDEIVDLADDVDQRVRAAALWALGQIGGEVAQRTLAKYISIDDEALRTAAENALQELEFFSSDLSDFFGPPGGAVDEADSLWHVPGLIGQDNDNDEDQYDDED